MSKFAIIDGRFTQFDESIRAHGFFPIYTKQNKEIYEEVSYHPDLQMCLDYEAKTIFVDIQFYEYYKNKLKDTEYSIIAGDSVKGSYPDNIKYNIVISKKFAVHYFKHTSRIIFEHIKNRRLEQLNIKQGYTKCSIIQAGDKYITDDDAIFNAFKSRNISILKVAKGFVELKGMEYGFIGGTSGFYDGVLYFSGKIKDHPDYFRIIDYLQEIKVVELSEKILTDVGTIFFL